MSKITFLGLGAMGSRMARRLLEAGHDLSIWNRTAQAMVPLRQAGATAAQNPRQAAQGVSLPRQQERLPSWPHRSTPQLGRCGRRCQRR